MVESEGSGALALSTALSPPAVASEGASEDLVELESVGSKMAYESFLAAAKALEPASVEECCIDVLLACEAVKVGVESVLGSASVVVGKLPNVNVEDLSMLPRLAQGLAFAALQVQRELKTSSFGAMYERAQTVRRKLRKAAEALAEANLLAEADADEVRLNAQREVLEDCLGLAAVLKRNEAKIMGRSPVGSSDVREAELVVEKLRVMLGQQKDSSESAEPSLVRVIEMRDRFWTLLKQRYDVLWRCGAWLFGRAVDDRVPPLPSRVALVRKPRKAPAEREAPRTASEPKRSMNPPALLPTRVSPSPGAPRETGRHLADLQRDAERKLRFLVRMGVLPSAQP